MLRARTISDEGSACQHFAQHELDDGQDDADQTADNGHAEQETILRGADSTQTAAVRSQHEWIHSHHH